MPHNIPGVNSGTVKTGTGRLTNINGTTTITTTVKTPIKLPSGENVLVDNETNAMITGGNGNDCITEHGANAHIKLGNGNDVITDFSGGATITVGKGNQRIDLGGKNNSVTVGDTKGGHLDVTWINTGSGNATVHAGNGNMVIHSGGSHNTITAGKGDNRFILGALDAGLKHDPKGDPDDGDKVAKIPITADTLHLGNGQNMVFLGGSGNTIYDGSGHDTIIGASTGHNTFTLNAAGGTEVIGGFNLTNGDKLNLSKILAGTTVTAATLGTFVHLKTLLDGKDSDSNDTVLTINGANKATATVTLLDTNGITLSKLVHSLILPT